MTQVQREAGFAEAIPKAIELEQKASAARQKYQEHRETLMANQFARERQFQYQAARDAEQHQMQRESWDRADDRDKERFARGVQEAERKEENQVFNQSVDGAIGNMAPGQLPGNEENEAEARTVRRELDRLRRASNDPNLPEESRQEARDQLTAALNGAEGSVLGQRIITLNSAKAPLLPNRQGTNSGSIPSQRGMRTGRQRAERTLCIKPMVLIRAIQTQGSHTPTAAASSAWSYRSQRKRMHKKTRG